VPNLKEFFNRSEKNKDVKLEVVNGPKPCYECDYEAPESFWDPDLMILSWTCPAGHTSKVVVN
jgi:hypothetical protein